jgi:glucose-6-phosphate isomerase
MTFLAGKLSIRQKIDQLYIINIVLIQHQEFNFKKITEPFIQKIKKDGFNNIITFGIGGSYEGPKLLQEFTKHQSSEFNYYFISGPDRDEFNSIVKPLSGQKNFYIFSSKSLSTDETLLMFKMAWQRKKSTNSIVITANSEKAKTLGFPENCIVPFPETVGGRYSIWSPISLSAALENNFLHF